MYANSWHRAEDVAPGPTQGAAASYTSPLFSTQKSLIRAWDTSAPEHLAQALPPYVPGLLPPVVQSAACAGRAGDIKVVVAAMAIAAVVKMTSFLKRPITCSISSVDVGGAEGRHGLPAGAGEDA
jgi:hypothetical protein